MSNKAIWEKTKFYFTNNVIQTGNYQITDYHNKMNKVDKSYYCEMVICLSMYVCMYVLVCYWALHLD